MKQVTGKTNSSTAIDKVSIRLALDGHSFSITGNREVTADTVVEVLTPRTLLVPAELLASISNVEKEMSELLAMAGLAMKSGECVIRGQESNGVVAIMALPQTALDQLLGQCKCKIRYTTPLSEITAEGTTLRIHYVSSLLYIKVYRENRLQFAEVIPIAGEEDLLYLFERLETEFALKDFRAIISGEETKKLRKLLGKRFKEVVCE